jgi:nitroreductase
MMDTLKAIQKRRSVRAYTAKPVPQQVVRELLEAAILAPSGSNTQPWKFYVVGGKRKQELDELLLKCLDEGRATSNELQQQREGGDEKAQEKINSRRFELTRGIMDLLRENDLPIDVFAKGSFKYFGAPVSVFITMDQSLGENYLLGIGAAVENLMLLACDRGLGTCWIGMALMYAKEIKQFLGVPDSERIVSSFALGYPDKDAPLHSFKSTRDPLESLVTWVGWE